MNLVLDGSDDAPLPPVHELRASTPSYVAVSLPVSVCASPAARGAGAEVGGAELLVGEVGEAVHPEAVAARAGAGVVRVHEPEVVPERPEAAVVLDVAADGVGVRLAVPHEPQVVHRARLGLRPRHAVALRGAGGERTARRAAADEAKTRRKAGATTARRRPAPAAAMSVAFLRGVL
jgi:hypothetical protein